VPDISQAADLGSPSGRRLPEADRRRLRVWRRILRASLSIAWGSLALELALLAWPRAPKSLRLTVAAVFIESLVTGVVLGAMGKCPACQTAFGFDSKRLMPERCQICGVLLS
jgi:hypothetical protein